MNICWMIRMLGFPVLFPLFAVLAGLRVRWTRLEDDLGELLFMPLGLPVDIIDATLKLFFWEYFLFDFTFSRYVSKCLQKVYDERSEKAERAYAKEENKRIENSTCSWCGRSFTGQPVKKLFGEVHCSKKCASESGR